MWVSSFRRMMYSAFLNPYLKIHVKVHYQSIGLYPQYETKNEQLTVYKKRPFSDF